MKTRLGRRGGSKEQGSLGRLVAERIKDDIFRGRLLPREPLIEAELAGAYGVSKTPVREALSSLARGDWWRWTRFAARGCVTSPPTRCGRYTKCARCWNPSSWRRRCLAWTKTTEICSFLC